MKVFVCSYKIIITFSTYRIHPESGQQSLRHSCPQCSKQFAHKAQLAKHLQNCDGKFDVTVKIKDNKVSTNLTPSFVTCLAKHIFIQNRNRHSWKMPKRR